MADDGLDMGSRVLLQHKADEAKVENEKAKIEEAKADEEAEKMAAECIVKDISKDLSKCPPKPAYVSKLDEANDRKRDKCCLALDWLELDVGLGKDVLSNDEQREMLNRIYLFNMKTKEEILDLYENSRPKYNDMVDNFSPTIQRTIRTALQEVSEMLCFFVLHTCSAFS
jgi:hypothetical protein